MSRYPSHDELKEAARKSNHEQRVVMGLEFPTIKEVLDELIVDVSVDSANTVGELNQYEKYALSQLYRIVAQERLGELRELYLHDMSLKNNRAIAARIAELEKQAKGES